MTTWLVRLDAPNPGTGETRLAVKDCIDVAGLPTTAGCQVVAEHAEPAADDAPVVASARRAGAVIVGKTNLSPLCWGADGINDWSGTPVNPLDPTRVPGGSSSGSAVAVATGEADVGYGTDTGGSVRIPAACCGIFGLKTTWGRIPTEGVYPLAPSLDTVGPLGRDLDAIELGMRLLEPGFTAPAYAGPMTVGRLRPERPTLAIAPEIDAALAAAGFGAQDVHGADFTAAIEALATFIDREGYLSNVHLLPDLARLPEHIQDNMEIGAGIGAAELAEASRKRDELRGVLDDALRRFPFLALPTLAIAPPPLGEPRVRLTALTGPINLAGLPALALPLTVHGKNLPASLQLVGHAGGEETLIAAGRIVAAALG
jgi:amidase